MRHISLKRVSARIFATALLLMGSLSASAQYYLNVYEKSGSNNQYEIENLDSVSISDVKAIDNTPVLTRLIINEREVNIETGGSTTLSVKGYDADGVEMTLDNLQWKSNDYSVASIDENGVVRTYKSGSAFIIASLGEISDTCEIIVTDHVYTISEVVKISLDKVELNVETGVGDSLSVKGFAADGTEIPLQDVVWKSNNTSVAMVNENGVVATHESGKALIIASLGTVSDTCKVTVVDHIYTLADVVKISINKDTLNLETGQSGALSVKGYAFDGTEIALKNILWRSSDSSIATVDENGLVKAQKKGTVLITASFGIISDTRTLVIVDHIYTLSEVAKVLLNKKDLNLETSDNYTLNVSGFAADGAQIPLEGVVWKSSNTSVATVDDNGVISALTKGTAFIISSLGDVSDTCIVNVKDKFVSIDVTVDSLAKSGVYLGVISFNKQLYTKPISLLNTDSKNAFDSFIDGMEMKNGTLLCYSVDNAIDSLGSVVLPDNVSKVAIVTFTDGLDQGSIDMIEAMTGQYYDSDDEYLAAIKHKIKTYSLAGVPIAAYSVGVRGSDVKDLSKFQSTLKQLASSDEYAIEVQNMSEVNAKFKEIASQLNRSVNYQTVPIIMPGLSNGIRVRFTFDNVADATNSSLYVEGTYNRRDRTLVDVEYHGMTSTSGSVVVGEITEVIFTKFTFENILTDDNSFINKAFINEWYMTPDGLWQQNSEFDPDQQPDIELEQNSIVIMLVLDCSSSLGDDFGTAKDNAKDFISTMYSATGGGDESNNGNGNNINDNFSIYSKTPIDLSLAVSIDGVRYYLTQEQYQKANLSKAIIEGLTVVFGGESFIMSLKDEPYGSTDYYIPYSFYYCNLPTREQGKVISARWSYINNALTAFGGSALNSSIWTNYSVYNSSNSSTQYYYAYSAGGGLGSSYYANCNIRLVCPIETLTPIFWNDPQDLTLVAYKDSERFIFTKEQWNNVVNKDDYEKAGVLVSFGSCKFIIALKDEPIDNLYQSNAITYYGSNLPSIQQGNIISRRWSAINNALEDFGGTKLSSNFWTNYMAYESSNSSWKYYYIYSGDVGWSYSSSLYPIRLVYEVDKYKRHEYVDMGLSVKWATTNVGAYNPEDNGKHYAWGELETKSDYTWSKYSYDKNILDLEDDVANVKWGGNWRIPTKEEFEELLDENNCDWIWTLQNGVNGYKVVSKIPGFEGNYIFIPVAGYYSGSNTSYSNRSLYYWTSSLYTSVDCGYTLRWQVNDGKPTVDYNMSRFLGCTIRPVCP